MNLFKWNGCISSLIQDSRFLTKRYPNNFSKIYSSSLFLRHFSVKPKEDSSKELNTKANNKNAEHDSSHAYSPFIFLREKSDVSSEHEASELLKNCGNVLFKESLGSRKLLLTGVWDKINKYNKENLLTTSLYNTYLQVTVENNLDIDCDAFLRNMKSSADRATYTSLLENVCQKGDIKQAVYLLEKMKSNGLSADEDVFNKLLMAYVVHSGINGGKSVIETMKQAHIPVTSNTHWAILKGLANRTNKEEFLAASQNAGKLPYDENKFFDMMLTLGLNDNYLWFKNFLDNNTNISMTRQSSKQLEKYCIFLINCNKPEAAIYFYKELLDVSSDDKFGQRLLKEMVKTRIPIEVVIKISKDLIESNLNKNALSYVTETTLRNGLLKESLELFKQLDAVRPHFFWPLIINAANENGEIGVMEILDEMKELQVEADFDTMALYILPNCDLSDTNALLLRLQKYPHLTLKNIINPLMYVLLTNNRVNEAKDLCVERNVELLGEKLISVLPSVWNSTRQSSKVAIILQKICETNSVNIDWAGIFILNISSFCKIAVDFKELHFFIKSINKKKLRISGMYSEQIMHNLKTQTKSELLLDKLEASLDDLLDIAKEDAHIKHPREMSLEDLECQLEELTSKGMETRGILRLMIQKYSRANNLKRITELRSMLKEKKYSESPGIMASIFHSYITAGEFKLAEEIFIDIKRTHPGFKVDDFKVVDFAKLLIENDKFEQAINVLEDGCCMKSAKDTIERNCWRLVSSAKTPSETFKIFDTLVQHGYCKASNIMLGPLIRSYINVGDLPKAVEVFCKCTEQYKCTPLQLELLILVVEFQDEALLQQILKAIAIVHGPVATSMALIAALAEKGLENALTKYLTEVEVIRTEEIQKRCARWSNEDKLLPLVTLSNAISRLSTISIDQNIVDLQILKVFSARNDFEGALNYWNSIQDRECISMKFNIELVKLLERCKQEVPTILRKTIAK